MTTPSLLDLDLPADACVKFFVAGKPAPQGSKAFKGMRGGHAILAESSKALGPWRKAVTTGAMVAMAGKRPMIGPACARLEFVLPRPKATPKRRTPPAIKYPDVDKLTRAIFDGVGGVVVANDSQIVDVHATKRIAEIDEHPGVHIQIQEQP